MKVSYWYLIMTVKITPASLYKPQTSHRFMKSMANAGLARFILLEAFVEGGRTYQAYKRGGFDEGRERITEEFTGAVFWLGGVKAFNAINDKIGKWILKLRTTDFDLGNDKARNPLANFLHSEKSTKTGKAFTEGQIAKFKSAKLIASILLANTMIGFVVPKINQAITRMYHKKDKNKENIPNEQNTFRRDSIDTFLSGAKKNKENISFGAGSSALLSLAYNLENNTTWQLLSTDIGTATGRTISARNNDERREILFRDLSSIYFYMFNMPNINKWLNMVQQNGRKTRVDSMNAAYTADLMKSIVKDRGGKISPQELEKEMFGDGNVTIPKSLKDEFKNGFMSIEEFKEKIPSFVAADKVKEYTEIAQKMSELQPKVQGVGRITLDQAERTFKGGYLNNPDFLKELYELSFGKNSKTKLPNFLDPYKFISAKSIDGVDSDLKYFVEQIIKKAKEASVEIDVTTLEKAVKKNFRLNAVNWGSGFAVSALFLSTLIPKIQYWITKKITGSNSFPGTEEFRNMQNQNAESKAA